MTSLMLKTEQLFLTSAKSPFLSFLKITGNKTEINLKP